MIPVKLLRDGAKLPTRKYESDAGLDLCCCEDFFLPGLTEVIFQEDAIQTIDTGIAMEIPEGYFGSIRCRSGLGSEGIIITGGVVDSGYRAEIKVTMINVGKSRWFRAGDKIAQIVIQPKSDDKCIAVERLSESERGEKGFGSSGR